MVCLQVGVADVKRGKQKENHERREKLRKKGKEENARLEKDAVDYNM